MAGYHYGLTTNRMVVVESFNGFVSQVLPRQHRALSRTVGTEFIGTGHCEIMKLIPAIFSLFSMFLERILSWISVLVGTRATRASRTAERSGRLKC